MSLFDKLRKKAKKPPEQTNIGHFIPEPGVRVFSVQDPPPEEGEFFMTVHDIFFIQQEGAVITGVAASVCYVGDTAVLKRNGKMYLTTDVRNIIFPYESNQQKAEIGQDVSLALAGVSREDLHYGFIRPGDAVFVIRAQ